jgi:hypothetical protein
MGKEISLITAALLLASIVCIQLVRAQEAAEYNFGTTQRDQVVAIEPGKTAETKIFFYNIWGNRATHVTLGIGEKPEGWNVKIEPELHNVTLNVTGIIITVQENLYAMPCKLDESWCPTNDTTPREGVEYISGSGIEGKIPAKYATITIAAPEGLPLWENYPLKITATAEWYGEAGMISLTQQRDFSYTLRTVTKEYTEQILEEEEKQTSLVEWLSNNLLYIIIGVLILIIFLIRKRKRR